MSPSSPESTSAVSSPAALAGSGVFSPVWAWWEAGATGAAENMAADEALLEWVQASGRPALRAYGWTEPAATFGYFQRHADVSAMTALRPLVRRPTGGGVVPHDADWTYSVAVPTGDVWYALKAVDSYCRVHEWLRMAFAELGVGTELSPCCVLDGPGQCFVGAERHDLLFQGRKIAGAAQRRRRDGLLIQGSIQAGATGLKAEAFFRAMRNVAARDWGVSWTPFAATPDFCGRVAALVSEKYAVRDYNEGR